MRKYAFAAGRFGLAMLVMGLAALPGVTLAATQYAMPVTLAWNAAQDAAIRGYAVYYGLTNQPATNRVDAGTNLQVTVLSLQPNQGYRFYAVSYNAVGIESLPSNEIKLIPPVLSKLQIARLANGQMQLSFKAAPGTSCRVQYASKPSGATWQTLATTATDSLGAAVVVDATAAQSASRFYRAVTP
jgi:hypothetical protein